MTAIDLDPYRTLIFDCDGVILNSNQIKTEAFVIAASEYGEDAALRLRDYHLANGGVSRYEKFAYFLSDVVESSDVEESYTCLLQRYGKAVHWGLRSATIADGLPELRHATPQASWLVVSGGDQEELRELFQERELARYFDGGIFGSPSTKEAILNDCCQEGIIEFPALYLGDTRHDHEVSSAVGLDFLFVEEWSEFVDWKEYRNRFEFRSVRNIVELLKAQ
jgi:phosphoglycolate phosphatase-like HAD superfamily hydrolase|tara:strand:+ start:90 stop:755 length:666 start_codon:yes stop_codon:yes gene_type:complete